MNVAEIIALAQSSASVEYADTVWIGFINAALDDLAPSSKYLKRETVNALVVAGGETSIPLVGAGANSNLVNAQEIISLSLTPTVPVGPRRMYRRLHASTIVSDGWQRDMDAIYVQGVPDVGGVPVTEVTAIVNYYKKLARVTSVADIPEIPEQYHYMIVPFICAMSQQKEEELDDKNDFYMDYLRRKNEFALDRTWEMEPESRKYIKLPRLFAKTGIQR